MALADPIIILSEDRDLINEFIGGADGFNVTAHRSLDAVKSGELALLAIDAEFFESQDTVQFHLSKIRKKIQNVPVILIFRANLLNELNFEWFFDDFIIFPFRRGELAARLKKLLTKKNITDAEDIITIGNLMINLREYSVYLNNEKLDFTYKEFELLRFLADNRGVVFSRKELLNRIWGVEYIGGTRTVDVHIRRLRSKIGEEFNTVIETIRNVGYKCRS
jgi:two-component SAPR family response regulator